MTKTLQKLLKNNIQNVSYTVLILLIISALINFNTPLIATNSKNERLTNSQINQNPALSKLLNKKQLNSNLKLPTFGFLQTNSNPASFQFISNSIYIQFETSKIMVYHRNTGVSFSITFPNSKLINPNGVNALNYNTNYFEGNIKLTNMKSYSEVWYYNLYNKIDLRYYITNNGLKYDFIAHPDSNPNSINLHVSKAISLDITSSSVNYYSNSRSLLTDSNLKVLQGPNLISSNFKRITDNQYGFNIKDYDKSKDLIIDPVITQIDFSTYIGSNQLDKGTTIAVDTQGNVYVVGMAGSSSFPTKNAFNSTYDTFYGSWFILKLNPSGNSIIYSTFINQVKTIGDIQVDSNGNLYAVGSTNSPNFPTKNAYNATLSGTLGSTDAFALKLNPTGDALIYSTYIGGSDNDYANSIAIDSNGDAYITGSTASSNFPIKNSYSSSISTSSDVFVLELNPTGNGLIYSTFIGGGAGSSIQIDSSGNAYVSGFTYSSNFPTKNAFNSKYGGVSDAFVLELNPTGNGLIYSTFIGGSKRDIPFSLMLGGQGNIYLAGNTLSSDFPTKNAFNSKYSGGVSIYGDIFVLKLNINTNSLIYSTYLGGSGIDYGFSLAVNNNGNAYVTGFTQSANFPTTVNSTGLKAPDIFLTILNPSGNDLTYSTLIGGTGDDNAEGMVLDQNNNVYLTGYTSSTDFPVKNAYNSTYGGNYDAFVLKMNITLPVVSNSLGNNNTSSSTPKGFLDLNIFSFFISFVAIIEVRIIYNKKIKKPKF